MSIPPSAKITFHATVFQDSDHPGATIYLSATIKEFSTPIGTATVKAKVILPNNDTIVVHYTKEQAGHFKSEYKTTIPGTYTFHVHAKGKTLEGEDFVKKKTVTGAVYYGD